MIHPIPDAPGGCYIYIYIRLRVPISPPGLRKAAQLITALCTYLPTTPLFGLDVLGFKHQHTATAAEAPVGDRAPVPLQPIVRERVSPACLPASIATPSFVQRLYHTIPQKKAYLAGTKCHPSIINTHQPARFPCLIITPPRGLFISRLEYAL